MPGYNLLPHLSDSGEAGTWPRDAVFSGRERHSSSRYRTLGYPCRCVRTATHLYIRNFAPERWPAGTPQKYAEVDFDEQGNLVASKLGPEHGGYHDIDACPTLDWMIAHRDQAGAATLFRAAVAKRPAEELYDIRDDPACLNNLVGQADAKAVHETLRQRLTEYLRETGDVRVTDPEKADVWETYPRVSRLRWFPTPQWAVESPEKVPRQDWLEKRRP